MTIKGAETGMGVPVQDDHIISISRIRRIAVNQKDDFVITFMWMAYCKTVVTPVLMHWSYHSLAISLLDNRQTSNIRRTLVGNKIVDHSDVVGA